MSENFENLDARLKKADPAVDAPAIGSDVLQRATNAKPTASKRGRLIASWSTLTAGLAAVLALSLSFTSSANQTLFELGAANQSGSSAQGLADSKMGGMDMLMPFVQYEFVAGSELSNSEQSGKVYSFTGSPSINNYMVELAKFLGIEGAATKVAYSTGTDFIIGGDKDGNWVQGKANIYYSTSSGSFSYTDEAAYGTWSCPADKSTDCKYQELPASAKKPMPTKAEAIAQASELFAIAAGFQDQQAKWDFQSGDGYASVTATMQIDGVDALQYSAYWSPSGLLAGAYGWCVDIESKGVLPTISAVKAVERLNDYRWGAGLPASFYTGSMFYGGVYRDTGVMVGGADSTTAGSSGGSDTQSSTGEAVDPVEPSVEVTAEPAPDVTAVPVETATAEPLPVVTEEPMPTPTIEKVEITKAVLTLVTVWDAKGRMWLVPGYALYADKGLVSGVIALHDGVIKLPEVMPMVK